MVSGDENGVGGIDNFVTKRADCRGRNASVMWTQVETGSAITWKYPSCVLKGDNSSGEFYSIAITNNMQQADTGTKTYILVKTRIVGLYPKELVLKAQNTYRGLVQIGAGSKNLEILPNVIAYSSVINAESYCTLHRSK